MHDPPPHDLQTWESLADKRIREAQEAGEFDNLPGAGQPIAGLDEPDDDLWWVKRKLREEKVSLLPPALQLRVDVEQGLARIWPLATAAEVERAVAALNEHIRQSNLKCIWGPPSTTLPLEAAEVLREWERRQSQA
jgi:hypothetical protein